MTQVFSPYIYISIYIFLYIYVSLDHAKSVLEFWFGSMHGNVQITKSGSWFFSTPEQDDEIKKTFGRWVRAAVKGGLKNWESHPRTALAKVILLDQFTRNIYRGTKEAFDGDKEARRVAKMALNRWPEYYHPMEKMFLAMPFMHSELINDQDLCIRYFKEMIDEARMNEHVEEEIIEHLENGLKFAESHRDVIRDFRRFPSRNKALERENTPPEEEYLKTSGGWGQ